MIQKGTYLNVLDNSGAKKVACIHVFGGYRKRYAKTGDTIVVAVKSVRPAAQDEVIKIRKGDVVKAIVVRTKLGKSSYSQEFHSFLDNSVALVNSQNKFFGTRVFGAINRNFRYTKCLRLLSIASGVIS
jgi:large subunit ribosomal protein L14